MTPSSTQNYSKPATSHTEEHDQLQQTRCHHHFITRIYIHGERDELITIGGQTCYRHELMSAFGGSLDPGARPYPKFNINSSPLGLYGFGLSCFVLGLFNCQAKGITLPNVAVSLACFYGATAQIIAGLLEFPTRNTFAFTALTSYGEFWLGYACVVVELLGIMAAYEGMAQFLNTMGLFLLEWVIWILIVVLITMKSALVFFLMFLFLDLTFIFLACAEITGRVGVALGGGVIGVITAFIAWYNGFVGTTTHFNSYIVPSDVFFSNNRV